MRLCQFRRDGGDRLFCGVAEGRTREISREGYRDRRDRVRHVHLRGGRELNVHGRVLAPRAALVLGLPDSVSRVVGTTRGSDTAATRRSLDATANLGLVGRQSGDGRGVFRVGSARRARGLERHDGEEGVVGDWSLPFGRVLLIHQKVVDRYSWGA